jgi:hypothetical protein
VIALGIVLLALAAALASARALGPPPAVQIGLATLEGLLPVPAAALCGAVGGLLLAVGLLRRLSAAPAAAPRVQPRAATAPAGDLRARARSVVWDEGVSLDLDARGPTPVRLVLTQAPPGRVRRAVGQLGALLAGGALPARVVVEFSDCPPSALPRHHEVQGALAAHLPRGSFRVVSQVDRVDVLFPEGRGGG